MLIREHEEAAVRRGAELTQARIGCQIAGLDLLQHHAQHDHVLDGRMLQQIHLQARRVPRAPVTPWLPPQ